MLYVPTRKAGSRPTDLWIRSKTICEAASLFRWIATDSNSGRCSFSNARQNELMLSSG
jgi:hypothetical protein